MRRALKMSELMYENLVNRTIIATISYFPTAKYNIYNSMLPSHTEGCVTQNVVNRQEFANSDAFPRP